VSGSKHQNVNFTAVCIFVCLSAVTNLQHLALWGSFITLNPIF